MLAIIKKVDVNIECFIPTKEVRYEHDCKRCVNDECFVHSFHSERQNDCDCAAKTCVCNKGNEFSEKMIGRFLWFWVENRMEKCTLAEMNKVWVVDEKILWCEKLMIQLDKGIVEKNE